MKRPLRGRARVEFIAAFFSSVPAIAYRDDGKVWLWVVKDAAEAWLKADARRERG